MEACRSCLRIAEIVGSIAGNLDDLATLKNFARTSKYINSIVEGILWQSIIVPTASILRPGQDGSDLPTGRTCPLRTLGLEKTHRRSLGGLEQDLDTEERLCLRSNLVRHLSLPELLVPVGRFDDLIFADGLDGHDFGACSKTFLGIVGKRGAHLLTRLRSLRIDGLLLHSAWDRLLTLPSLDDLRLWGSGSLPTALLDVTTIHRLRSLELGGVFMLKGTALATAILGSSLESLHLCVKGTSADSLVGFLRGLEGVRDDLLPPLLELGLAVEHRVIRRYVVPMKPLCRTDYYD